ncbi:MAG: hypothetical protein PUD79_06035 [Prevotellaceae bacterium]|nr:hypothetical protein [Prevotellaceae bacterium]
MILFNLPAPYIRCRCRECKKIWYIPGDGLVSRINGILCDECKKKILT